MIINNLHINTAFSVLVIMNVSKCAWKISETKKYGFLLKFLSKRLFYFDFGLLLSTVYRSTLIKKVQLFLKNPIPNFILEIWQMIYVDTWTLPFVLVFLRKLVVDNQLHCQCCNVRNLVWNAKDSAQASLFWGKTSKALSSAFWSILIFNYNNHSTFFEYFKTIFYKSITTK